MARRRGLPPPGTVRYGFSVTALIDLWSTGAQLRVGPGRLSVWADLPPFTSGTEVVHSRSRVVEDRARWGTRWFGSTIELIAADGRRAAVRIPARSRLRVLAALQECGFDVDVRQR